MEKILECPVCLEVPKSTPIYQCEKGHIHCQSCHQNLNDCPVCRSKNINNRALVAEQIIANLVQKCQFSRCTKSNVDIIKQHESECEFAEVYCNTCENMVWIKDLDKHGTDCNLVSCHQCQKKVKIKTMTIHEELYCDFSIVRCYNCEFDVFFKDMATHETNCLIRCQNVNCNAKLTKAEFKDHIQFCYYQRVQCRHIGCKYTTFRKYLKGHEKNCQRMTEVQNRLDQLTPEIDKLKKTHTFQRRNMNNARESDEETENHSANQQFLQNNETGRVNPALVVRDEEYHLENEQGLQNENVYRIIIQSSIRPQNTSTSRKCLRPKKQFASRLTWL